MKILASPFDSAHYRMRVARLHIDETEGDSALGEAEQQAISEGYDVVFARVLAGTPVHAAFTNRGAHHVDELITSRRDVGGPVQGSTELAIEHLERLVEPRDIEAVARMTAHGITRSHLHADVRLPVERTRELYERWAINDVTGRAQGVFIARVGETVAGYISVLTRDGNAILDLVVVSPERRGLGIGGQLVAACCRWATASAHPALVGTQADNPALRLYARAGFVPVSTHLTYHLWTR